ncbi:MAG: cation diffusion facilitator family transporter [Dehalococcoidia bacterium]|nr:cation diffusion facilitator family transporter [Dehalococcoidia bacterium]
MTEHSHSHLEPVSGNRLALALGLSATILVLELVFGFVANSLALISDAGHVLTDIVAISLSWFGVAQAMRPATAKMTFGYHRVGILVALFNSALIFFIAVVIIYEAYQRLQTPEEVGSLLMFSIAFVGLAANVIVFFWLRGEAKHSLNMRSALVHAGGDALASVGVIVGGLIIFFTGWFWVDPIVSVVIAVIIVAAGWSIAWEAISVMIESTPRNLNVDELVRTVLAMPGVQDVHDLHIWSLTPELHALSCHVQADDSLLSEKGSLLSELQEMLRQRYNIRHTTIQLECSGCEGHGLFCALRPAPAHEEEHAEAEGH